MKRKILLLGGSGQQVTAIRKARQLGYHTVLCDYLGDNPGQYTADAFYQVSTTDKEAVLKVAEKEHIDGILAYASDPAAPTAAYVGERLGLPTNSCQAVNTLCNKNMFRHFLRENSFHAPQSGGYAYLEEVVADIRRYRLPIIVKPEDSSGSKGVSVMHSLKSLDSAVKGALSFSRSGKIVVEEFIEKRHPYLIGGDIFVWNGKVILWGLMNCHRDNQVNPLVPVGKSYPPNLSEEDICRVKATLQQMVDRLHFSFGAMNVELVIDKDDRVWPIDVGPRSGGNMIPELLGMVFGIDVVEMSVKAAMGDRIQTETEKGAPYYATHNLHSSRSGIFSGVFFSDELKPHILREHIYKHAGDRVEYFDNAAKAVGIVFLKFDNGEEMEKMLSDINKHIVVRVKESGG